MQSRRKGVYHLATLHLACLKSYVHIISDRFCVSTEIDPIEYFRAGAVNPVQSFPPYKGRHGTAMLRHKM